MIKKTLVLSAFIGCLAPLTSAAQSWQEQMSEPLLQKEQLTLPATLDSGIFAIYQSKVLCPKKEINYRFSKFILEGVHPPEVQENELKASANHWFELVLANSKITTTNMLKTPSGKETTKSSLTQYDMLKQAYAYLKELEPAAFELSCTSSPMSLKEIEFDLNAIQLKGKVCEKMQCITNSGEFWTEISSNHMSRSFSTEQEASDWFKFVITSLAKLPTVSYDKRLTKEYQKITLEKVLKENILVLELLVFQNKKQVSITLN